jgi:hypothetical protein
MFGGQIVLPSNDKYAQSRNVKWVASFVLFAAWAVLIPGLLVIVSVYTHAFYRNKYTKRETIGDSTSLGESLHGNLTTAPASTSSNTYYASNAAPSTTPLSSASVANHNFSVNSTKNSNLSSDPQHNVLMRQLQAAKAAAEARKD